MRGGSSKKPGRQELDGIIEEFRKFKIQDLTQEGNQQTYHRTRIQPIEWTIEMLKDRETKQLLIRANKLQMLDRDGIVQKSKQLANRVYKDIGKQTPQQVTKLFSKLEQERKRSKRYQFEVKPHLIKTVELNSEQASQGSKDEKPVDSDLLRDNFFVKEQIDSKDRFDFKKKEEKKESKKDVEELPTTLQEISKLKSGKGSKFYPHFRLEKTSLASSKYDLQCIREVSSAAREAAKGIFKQQQGGVLIKPGEYFLDPDNIRFGDIINLVGNRIPKVFLDQKFLNIEERNRLKKEIDQINKKLEANRAKEKSQIIIETDLQILANGMQSSKTKSTGGIQQLLQQLSQQRNQRQNIKKLDPKQTLNRLDMLKYSVQNSIAIVCQILEQILLLPASKPRNWLCCKRLLKESLEIKDRLRDRRVSKYRAIDLLFFCTSQLSKIREQRIEGLHTIFQAK